MRFPTPIHVFSDLHLGHPASHLTEPELLFPALEGAATVILNGDSCELLNLRRKELARAKLLRLLDHCRRRNIVCVQLTGNHDPVASTLHHLDLMDGRVFITHGDALHRDVAPWSREAKSLRAERRRIEAVEPAHDTLESKLLLAKQCALVVAHHDPHGQHGWMARVDMAARFAVEPWRAVRAARYWAGVRRYSARIRNRFRPQARLMLIGHSHRPQIWQMSDWTLVNTGSFQPLSYPLMVKLTPDRVRVLRLTRKEAAYCPGRMVADFEI